MKTPFIKTKRGNTATYLIPAIALLVLGGILASFCLFTVTEKEQALVIQFGEVRGDPITEAGLHFKMPYQKVERFEKRLLRWDGSQTTTITRDRRTVNIDVTARWFISDARRFREAVRNTSNANALLNGIIEGAVNAEIARFDLFEIIRSSNNILDAEEDVRLSLEIDEAEVEAIDADAFRTLGSDLPRLTTADDGSYLAGRPIVLQNILADARDRLERGNLGIELEDVLIKQLSYIREIEANVYAQMNAELQKIAAGFRSSGQQRAEQRLGEMERELSIIESSAIERAQRIRGEAEAESIAIYADAFNADPEFFLLLRRLESFDQILGSNTRLVLGTDSPLFSLLKRLEDDEKMED